VKLLHVIPAYEPAWAFGGTITFTSLLCRELASLGVDVTVCTTNSDGKGGELDVRVNAPVNLGGVKVIYFPCDFQKKRAFYSRLLSRKIMTIVPGFDIVHVTSVWQYHQVTVAKVCKKHNIPYVVSPQGSFQKWPLKQRTIRKRLYWLLFGKRTTMNAAAVHFTAQEERIESLSLIPEVRSFIVSNGIKVPTDCSFPNDIRKQAGIPDTAFLLLHLGRINRKKGIDLVIKALGILKNKRIFLLVVGNVDDERHFIYLKKLVTILNLENNVIFHGQVAKEYTESFYTASDLFVLTSYSENFANAVAEAMSFGLPVLISRRVGIWREIEEDVAGIIVDLHETDIAQSINKIIDDSHVLEKISQNARDAALNRYDIRKVALQMMRAYEDILSGIRSLGLQWN
jgi:glycosyltransferase involved in cell wall biosynthesis